MFQAQALTETARAKVNLTLRIRGRRADGFHELDSIVAFAAVGDQLTLRPGGPATIDVTGPFGADIQGENLVARAFDMLAKSAPRLTLGRIGIVKNLPVAAGIGGGSADAAAALRLIRRANPAAAAGVDWAEIAAQLGSDVPVCLANRSCRMTGRGETLMPIERFPVLHAVLINPMAAVPADKTRQVFKRLNAPPLDAANAAGASGGLPAGRDQSAWFDCLRNAVNDLEAPACAIVPAIADVLAAAKADRLAPIVRLSGAGPTCFALTASPQDARILADSLTERHPTWWVRATLLS